MKQPVIILCACAIALSCTVEPQMEKGSSIPISQTRFTAPPITIGVDPATRADWADPSDNNYNILWEVGDSIEVANQYVPDSPKPGTSMSDRKVVKMKVVSIDPATGAASFEITPDSDPTLLSPDSDVFYAAKGAFGASAPFRVVSENRVQTTVQTNNYLMPETINNNFHVAVARAVRAADGSVNFRFRNAISYIKFTVPETDQPITKIVGVGLGKTRAQRLSCYLRLTFDADGNISQTVKTNGSDEGGAANIAYYAVSDPHSTTAGTFVPNRSYYGPIAPNSVTKGLYVTIGGVQDKSSYLGEQIDCGRSRIIDLGTFPAEGSAAPKPEPVIEADYHVLLIGNSFMVDASEYLPQLLRLSGGPKTIALTRIYHGGRKLETWNSNYAKLNDCARRDIAPGQIYWRGDDELNDCEKSIVESARWDLILIANGTIDKNYEMDASEKSALNSIVSKLRANLKDPSSRLGYLTTQCDAVGYSNDAYAPIATKADQDAQWQRNLTKQKWVEDNVEGIDFFLSTAATMQNLRTTVLNADHPYNLARDGHHLDYGIGRYAAACTLYQGMLAGITGVDIENIPLRVDWQMWDPARSANATAITSRNAHLAQKAARASLADMYSVTDLSSLSYNETPDPELPVLGEKIQGVTFPVKFLLGYDNAYIISAARQSKWRSDGLWMCPDQQQAHMLFRWGPRFEGETDRPYVGYGQSGNSISTIKVYGAWTGDYYQFNIPVTNLPAGSTINVYAPFLNNYQPVFWDLEYYDEGQWKCDRSPQTRFGFTRECSFSIGYGLTEISRDVTFTGAITDDYVRIRFKVADGSIQATSSTTAVERTAPYKENGAYGGKLYFSNTSGTNAVVFTLK